MNIQINTDHNIEGNERLSTYLETKITEALSRFEQQLSRIEVHLTDENGEKQGKDEKRCLLEARLEGLDPVAVSGLGDTIEAAVNHAVEKMKTKLTTITDKMKNH